MNQAGTARGVLEVAHAVTRQAVLGAQGRLQDRFAAKMPIRDRPKDPLRDLKAMKLAFDRGSQTVAERRRGQQRRVRTSV